jgi:hypothetical protein
MLILSIEQSIVPHLSLAISARNPNLIQSKQQKSPPIARGLSGAPFKAESAVEFVRWATS